MNIVEDIKSMRGKIAALVVALMSGDNDEIEEQSILVAESMLNLVYVAQKLNSDHQISDQNLALIEAANCLIIAANDEDGTGEMAVLAASALKIAERQI